MDTKRKVRHQFALKWEIVVRVLIADDNRDLLLSFRLLVEFMGHDVKTAPDGWTAVGIAREWKPELILLDIGMPDIVGFEVAKLIRETRGAEHTRIVAITGYHRDPANPLTGLFDGWLEKPVSEESLAPFLN